MENKEYAPYTSKRWTEIPAAEPAGHFEMTPEEETEAHEKLLKLIARSEEICAKKKAGIPVDDRL